MTIETKKEGKFEYFEEGEGHPIILLHGLLGALSNFTGVMDYFPKNGFKVLMPSLPLYSMPIPTTNVKNIAKFVHEFIEFKGFDKVTLIGNSLGGHVALVYTKRYPEKVHSLVLSGSSGLYESAFGGSYPRRGDYDFIKQKTEEVFYNKSIADKELVDSVYDTLNDRNRVIRTIAISKSAIRHNMSPDLPNFNMPVCLIWGKQDIVTPPEVAERFHELLPNSELTWIDECGHAAMMEHPDKFNEIMHAWLKKIV